MCGDKGSIFVFDNAEEAKVFCTTKCQTHFEYDGRIGTDPHEILIMDPEKIAWLSFTVVISVLLSCFGLWWYLESNTKLFSRLLEKLQMLLS
jgi:hypothetical protein